MITGIDFSIDHTEKITLIICGLFPIILMLFARMPKFVGNNALQFLCSYIFTTILLVIFIKQRLNSNIESLFICFFLYHSIILVYLEIWGLLSRGYTLGILLTFYKANVPLNVNELAHLYRGGEGLSWLISHRFRGLQATKMIELQGDKVLLTTRGVIIAYLYQLSVKFFGLKNTG